jgi:nitrite reductase/ring-hydroxylating ferredoxin subunit
LINSTTLCRSSDIPDGAGRGFIVDHDGGKLGILIVRRGAQVHAYHNVCPHKGLNLDWKPDAFMDDSRQYIQCANHDALFRVEDGYCISGPCQGASLRSVPTIVTADGAIQLLCCSNPSQNERAKPDCPGILLGAGAQKPEFAS